MNSKFVKLIFIALFIVTFTGCVSVVNSYRGVPATITEVPKWPYDSKVKYLEAQLKYEKSGHDDSVLKPELETICAQNPDALYDLILLARKNAQPTVTCTKDGWRFSKSIDDYWIQYLAYAGYSRMFLDEAKYIVNNGSINKQNAIEALGLAYAAKSMQVDGADSVIEYLRSSLSSQLDQSDFGYVELNATHFTYNIEPLKYSNDWFGCSKQKCDPDDADKANLADLTGQVRQARADYLAEQDRIRLEQEKQRQLIQEQQAKAEKDAMAIREKVRNEKEEAQQKEKLAQAQQAGFSSIGAYEEYLRAESEKYSSYPKLLLGNWKCKFKLLSNDSPYNQQFWWKFGANHTAKAITTYVNHNMLIKTVTSGSYDISGNVVHVLYTDTDTNTGGWAILGSSSIKAKQNITIHELSSNTLDFDYTMTDSHGNNNSDYPENTCTRDDRSNM
jgi:regulator of replication initiation timing